MNPETIARVEACAAAEFAKDQVGGVSVGLVADGRLAWSGHLGFADTEQGRVATPETVYRIGSVTKRLTGLMAMQMAAADRIDFNDPVVKYFPEVKAVTDRFPSLPAITLLQLATHTAGLAREPDHMAIHRQGPVSEWERTLIASLPSVNYCQEPGARFVYSNAGYAILGAALGRAAGVSYVACLAERLLAPLGMTRTGFAPGDRSKSDLAQGYVLMNGVVNSAIALREHEGRGYAVPNGSLYSTMSDLARLLCFELGDGSVGLLTSAGLAESRRPRIVMSEKPRTEYALGLIVATLAGKRVYGHNGSVAGYTAEAWFEPVSKIGVIVLRNASSGRFSTINIVRSAFGPLTKDLGPTDLTQ